MRWAGWLGAARQAQGVKGVARPDHSSLLTRDALSSVPPPLQSLNYAQAGASVRTCAYRLAPPVEKGQLPWVAASIATGGAAWPVRTGLLERGPVARCAAQRRLQSSRRPLLPQR